MALLALPLAAAFATPSRAGLLRTALRRGTSVAASTMCAAQRRGILWDADGTLLDSLPPHIDFLHRMSAELGFGLALPERSDLAACRAIAAAPMSAFVARAGFPDSSIARCVDAYEARFASEHPVRPFGGVGTLLGRLGESGVRCAVVSSNTAANVVSGLGPDLAARFEFVEGIDTGPADKAAAIEAACARLGLPASAVSYVGDTAKDCAKAREAGVAFIGVSYGFEDLAADASVQRSGAPVAASVLELQALLCGAAES